MTQNCIWWWGSCSEVLTSVENLFIAITSRSTQTQNGSICGVQAKVQDCGLEVSDFELQSGYYVHFQDDTLAKGMK